MRFRPRRRPDWRRLRAHLPMTIALAGVAAVWVVGCVWSFTEQRAFADAHGFGDPALLPLALDGLAASMAAVAFAASLDGRPAIAARLVTAFGVAASAASNATWAAERSHVDPATIAMGVVMPVVANLAFEVLLGELRRQVQRARGLPAPAAIPTLRIIRLVLAPRGTFTAWRRVVLEVTALDAPRRAPAALPPVVEAPPVEEDEEEPQDSTVDAEEDPAGDQPDAEPEPPALTGHKKNDARAYYFHERRHGRTPRPVDVNRWIDSDNYVMKTDLTKWEQEFGREHLSVVGGE